MYEIDSLPVPKFDFAAIKERTHSPRKIRRRGFIIAALALLVPAMAAAAVVNFFHPQVYQQGDTVHVYSYNLTTYLHPAPVRIAKAIRSLSYPIVLPTDLPQNARLGAIMVADSELLGLTYACPRKRNMSFLIGPLQMSSLMHPSPDPHYRVMMTRRTGLPWHAFVAGKEIVRASGNCLTKAQFMRMRSATIAAGKAAK